MTEVTSQVSLFKPVDVDKLKVEGNSIREFTQVLKIQFVKDGSEIQVVFDRQHKKNMRLSKPVGYIRFTAQECIKLSAMFLAAATALLATRQAKGLNAKVKAAKGALEYYSWQVKETAEPFAEEIVKTLEGEG